MSAVTHVDMALLDSIAAAVLVLDQQGAVVAASRRFQQWTGYTPALLAGKHLPDLVDEADHLMIQSLFNPFNPAIFPVEPCIAWRCADGERVRAWLLCQPAGDLVVGTLRPVVDDLELYRQLYENSEHIQLLIHPADSSIVDASPAAARYYGYSRSALRQMSLRQLTGPGLLPQLQAALRGDLAALPLTQRLADGTLREARLSFTPLLAGPENLLGVLVQDVTESQEIERTLRESEARFRLVVETMQQGVSVQDSYGRMLYCNDVFCDIAGFARAELLGEPVLKVVHPDHHPEVLTQIKRRQQGESVRYETVFRHKNGEDRYVLIAATPIMGEAGDYRGSFAIVVDVTPGRRVEQALLKSNAELDAFAHTVAHDLKSPLAVLIGFADILIHEFEALSREEMRQYLEVVGDTADKMIHIIDELMLLSQTRHQTMPPAPLNTPQIIEGALIRLRYTIQKYGAEVIVPPPEQFPAAQGYAPWVEAVWANYISNAIKYGGVPPRVELSATRLDDGRICFSVKDNGRGIAPEKMARLFIPFERLEEARIEGHGIGLSIVRRILEKLNGEVRVVSAPGAGSTFSFILPAVP
jgi:PAS domain S-box-containing protein